MGCVMVKPTVNILELLQRCSSRKTKPKHPEPRSDHERSRLTFVNAHWRARANRNRSK